MKILWDRRNVLPLQQHAYPASRKNSALRVSFLFYIPMITNKTPYPKQLISFTDQISLLKQRGMIFGDEAGIRFWRTSNSIFSNRAAHLRLPITSTSLTANSAN